MNRAAGRPHVERLDAQPWARTVNIAMKISIVVAFAVAIFVPLDVLEGKGMAFRAPFFVGVAGIVPLLQRFRPRDPYPHIADGLVVAPFLVDTLGNLLGFYDRYNATDDVLHTVNWVLLVLAFHAFRFRRATDNRDARLLGAGFGALAIVAWEIAEWIVQETGAGGGLSLTYGDTIGDLTLSTSGGVIGSFVGVAVLGYRRSGRSGAHGRRGESERVDGAAARPPEHSADLGQRPT
jgi:hypothetical protein